MIRTLLAASAWLALAGTANASTASTTISIDEFCDVMTITVQDKKLAAALETDDNGRCETFMGEGQVAKAKVLGRVADVSGNYNFNSAGVATLDLQYPLVTGGAWNLYVTTDGVNMQFVASGTYTVTAPGTELQKPRRRMSDLLRR